eukprot:scaffold9191_cov114-Isochrysis_galbana.AAC.8
MTPKMSVATARDLAKLTCARSTQGCTTFAMKRAGEGNAEKERGGMLGRQHSTHAAQEQAARLWRHGHGKWRTFGGRLGSFWHIGG